MANQATRIAHELATEIHPTNEDIAVLAYRLWQENGCPDGTQEEDWVRAEQQLTTTQESTLQAPRR
jgi:hypothetical protein